MSNSTGMNQQVESRKVLVVDDDDHIARGTMLRLDAAGYETSRADDGDTGLAAIQNRRFDLVVLDVQMPRMSGIELLKTLKQSPETENIPVVMLSASLGDQQSSLDAGARFFVKKPYSSQQLLLAADKAMQ